MIKNKKTVDPKDDSSTPVFQLETAMGAAIECFKGATAIVVPRTRFAPVKKCNDLLLLRSDAYACVNSVPVLAEGVSAAPSVSLDSKVQTSAATGSELDRRLRAVPQVMRIANGQGRRPPVLE